MKRLKVVSVLTGALVVAGVASSAQAAPEDGLGGLGNLPGTLAMVPLAAGNLAPGGAGLPDLGGVTNLAGGGGLSSATGILSGLGGLAG